ncbi:hypothetical protein VTK56DRAFT_6758 [Thermocarpiscus australiensis]
METHVTVDPSMGTSKRSHASVDVPKSIPARANPVSGVPADKEPSFAKAFEGTLPSLVNHTSDVAYSLPSYGTPIILEQSQSQTRLLITYFGRNELRPDDTRKPPVRARVTPSSKLRSRLNRSIPGSGDKGRDPQRNTSVVKTSKEATSEWGTKPPCPHAQAPNPNDDDGHHPSCPSPIGNTSTEDQTEPSNISSIGACFVSR